VTARCGRIIHEGGFTRDDNKTYIPLVRSNTVQALVAIIRAMATLHIDFADTDREVFIRLFLGCLSVKRPGFESWTGQK